MCCGRKQKIKKLILKGHQYFRKRKKNYGRGKRLGNTRRTAGAILNRHSEQASLRREPLSKDLKVRGSCGFLREEHSRKREASVQRT